MNRKLAIGDIHGGLLGLEQLLERIQLTKGDQLIFLGDYVDGWSESYGVINKLIELQSTVNCTFIKGNHDDLTQTWLETNEPNNMWYDSGGKATMHSYKGVAMDVKNKHIAFFKSMKPYHTQNNKLFIHAGFTSMHGPAGEVHKSNYMWDRTLWEMAVSFNPTLNKTALNFPKRLKHFDEIYIGHTPTTRFGSDVPMQGANVWNVDTGAAFKGKLSAIEIASKQVWQSDPLHTLYPNEKGRN